MKASVTPRWNKSPTWRGKSPIPWLLRYTSSPGHPGWMFSRLEGLVTSTMAVAE